MFTPIDIQNHSLKTAVRGYSKKETDDFLEEILKNYEELYKENKDLKDKISSLSDGIQYYKEMESTLQKALVLAEKTSTETQEAAKSKAESLIAEAEAKAEAMHKEADAYSEVARVKANKELEETRNHVRKLVQSYENYRLQFKKLAESQIEVLESEHFSIFVPELAEMLDDAPDADEAASAEVTPSNYRNKEEERKHWESKETALEEASASSAVTEGFQTEQPAYIYYNLETETPEKTEEPAVIEDTIDVSEEIAAVSKSIETEETPSESPDHTEEAVTENTSEEAAADTEETSAEFKATYPEENPAADDSFSPVESSATTDSYYTVEGSSADNTVEEESLAATENPDETAEAPVSSTEDTVEAVTEEIPSAGEGGSTEGDSAVSEASTETDHETAGTSSSSYEDFLYGMGAAGVAAEPDSKETASSEDGLTEAEASEPASQVEEAAATEEAAEASSPEDSASEKNLEEEYEDGTTDYYWWETPGAETAKASEETADSASTETDTKEDAGSNSPFTFIDTDN